MRSISAKFLLILCSLVFCVNSFAWDICTSEEERQAKREDEIKAMQEKFTWWPTDAQPGPVKDDTRSGYWWWPKEPGSAAPWGNRGYIYLHKIIYDYRSDELPPAKPHELRPSLLIKKIIKNVKVYFDYDSSSLREDALAILKNAAGTLKRNPSADILITGNCDTRGPESYNIKLGRRRAEAVRQFMMQNGIPEERIRIVSRGKLDAVAPVSDLVGMQKDRNAQFVIAEVEEVMIPAQEAQEEYSGLEKTGDNRYIVEEETVIESQIKVDTREYVVKKGDTLWKIAQEQYGAGYRWKYLYELNKDRIKDPNKLKAGTTILIPVE